MQQRVKVLLSSDDDDDVQQEVTETIEKFVQTRHVQTLKYLQHVIDENRHLRLHIEHLKRRQNDPNPSPGVVDPIDPEDPPLTEIPVEIPDEIRIPPLRRVVFATTGTNTDGEDFQAKSRLLEEEIVNLKKEHRFQREEFQRELERLDEKNAQHEEDFKAMQQQLIQVQKQDHDKQTEIRTLLSCMDDLKSNNKTANLRINKLEEENRLLINSLEKAEETRLQLEYQLHERFLHLQQTEQRLNEIQHEKKSVQTQLQLLEDDFFSLRKVNLEEKEKRQEINQDNHQLREHISLLQQQLEEKIQQEEKLLRERQSNQHFKEFVQIKRTLQSTQQENEQLKIELKKVQIRLINNKLDSDR